MILLKWEMTPKRSFEVIVFNFKGQFHIRVETAIMQHLNINLSYKLFDLNWVLSSHVTRWRCRIISWCENHVIYFALKIHLSKIHLSESRDSVMVSWFIPTRHASYIQYIIFCLLECDYGSKKEILINPSRFRIFWWRHQFSGPR